MNIKFRSIFAIIVFALTAIVFLFATPAVNIKAFGKEIKFDGLNLKTISEDKYEGEMEFKRGLDFKGGQKYTFNLSLAGIEEQKQESYIKDIVEKFTARLNLYGFRQYDLNWSQIDKSTAKIELTTAKKSESDFAVIQLLASRGQIDFWTEDPEYDPESADAENFSFLTGMKQADISQDDIKSIESLYSNKANGYGFKVRFKKETAGKLFLLSQTEATRGTMFVIDGQATGFRTYQIENLNGTGNSDEPIMYMSSLFGASFEVNDIVPVLERTGTMPSQLDLLSEETVTPLLGEDFESNAKFILFISLAIISFGLLFKYRLLGVYQISLVAIFTIWLLALLKIQGVYLDLTLIFGSIVALVIQVALNLDSVKEVSKVEILSSKNAASYMTKFIDKSKNKQTQYRKYLLYVMGVSVVLSYIPFYEISSFAIGLGTGSVVGLILSFVSLGWILPLFTLLQKKYEKI